MWSVVLDRYVGHSNHIETLPAVSLTSTGTYTFWVDDWHGLRTEYRFRVTLIRALQYESEDNDDIPILPNDEQTAIIDYVFRLVAANSKVKYHDTHRLNKFSGNISKTIMSDIHQFKLPDVTKKAHAKVIMLTAYGSMQTAVKALQLGAIDYITKPVQDWAAVTASIQRARKERELQVENERLVGELTEQNVAPAPCVG